MLVKHAQQFERQHVAESLHERAELLRDAPRDAVRNDELDVFFLVGLVHGLIGAARLELDDDVLAEAILGDGEGLFENIRDVVIPGGCGKRGE